MNQYNTSRILSERYGLTPGAAQSTTSDYPLTTKNIGAAATSVTAVERGNGIIHQTVLTFAAKSIAVTDAGSTGHASLKIYDFPEGMIRINGVLPSLAIATTAAWAPTTPVVSLGTAAAGAGATLLTTEQNVVPSTAITITDGASTLAAVTGSVTAISLLVDSSAGTASDTAVAALADGSTYANDIAALRNNLATLAAKINQILAGTSTEKSIVLNGTGTAADLYFNFACNSDPSTSKTLELTGTITINWEFLGDIA
jgi:hypothetical protein